MVGRTRRHRGLKSAFRSAGWVFVLGLLFTVPALTIDFFHTEHDGLANDHCPACQLQQSATAAGTAATPEIPAPEFRPCQIPPERTNVDFTVDLATASRSPPSA